MPLRNDFTDGTAHATVHAAHHNALADAVNSGGGGSGGGDTVTAAKTANYTAASGELIPCNTTSAGFTITLPAATSGRYVTILKTDNTSNIVTVVGASGALVDGDTAAYIVSQYTAVTLIADGTNWYIKSAYRDNPTTVATAGTSFPTTPSTGQQFFRTDRALDYYYDGTRWLTKQLFEVPSQSKDAATNQASSLTGTTFFGQGALPYLGVYSIWVEKVDYEWQYAGGTINGSNYWVHGLYYADAATNRTLVQAGSNRTADVQSTVATESYTVGAILSANAKRFEFAATKTGTPPAVFAIASVTHIRLVG